MKNSLFKEKRYVIIRDDDTNAFTDPVHLDWLYRPFLDRDLPVNLATIPAVSSEARRQDGKPEEFLRGNVARVPRHSWIGDNHTLVDYLQKNSGYHIVQHGFDHSFHEFASRDRADLARRLHRGTAHLIEAGFHPPETFVAPYDHISPESFSAIIGRFRVVSTGWFEWRRIPPRWWPAYLYKKVRSSPHWHVGGTHFLSHPGCILSRFRERETMLDTLKQAVARSPLTVLVTHWWEYFPRGRPDDAFINILHQTAEFLASDPGISVIRFSDIGASALRASDRAADRAWGPNGAGRDRERVA